MSLAAGLAGGLGGLVFLVGVLWVWTLYKGIKKEERANEAHLHGIELRELRRSQLENTLKGRREREEREWCQRREVPDEWRIGGEA